RVATACTRRLQRAHGRKVTWRTRLAARLIKLFNARSRHYAIKFKRDDFNRYFQLKHSRFDPNDNLLQGSMISVEQAMNLYHLLCQVLVMQIPGEAVELGCYEGTTAVLLQTTLDQFGSAKALHVYDSFEGLPAPSAADGATAFGAGDCRATQDALLANFRRYDVEPPVSHPGWFQDALPAELPAGICFAHVDGDLHASILESLEAVYPRLAEGAIAVVDDYCDQAVYPVPERLPGVKKACDEFLRDKPERMHLMIGGCNSHGYFRKGERSGP